jgi:hypothetical protein
MPSVSYVPIWRLRGLAYIRKSVPEQPSLGNVVGQVGVRIEATVSRFFGGDDEVVTLGITVRALQDDMKRAAQYPVRRKLMDTDTLRPAVVASGVSLSLASCSKHWV